ncbi:hypothetical protein BX661DRAFT_188722 [Kickxella alabastrina]|uniref:uncharacterized protein n=1 Tax=Kickxella alabastrina TaxID=61397 RepID=UPI00221FA52D|nr:uncharacterized protein BX661DRAFT_188722 [Kickxella alabastrina]KAI7820881.1 hypothetical protein BX661DRAFT_188722 [Kickxella alabastrina]
MKLTFVYLCLVLIGAGSAAAQLNRHATNFSSCCTKTVTDKAYITIISTVIRTKPTTVNKVTTATVTSTQPTAVSKVSTSTKYTKTVTTTKPTTVIKASITTNTKTDYVKPIWFQQLVKLSSVFNYNNKNKPYPCNQR